MLNFRDQAEGEHGSYPFGLLAELGRPSHVSRSDGDRLIDFSRCHMATCSREFPERLVRTGVYAL
jgi:hypothetical protein